MLSRARDRFLAKFLSMGTSVFILIGTAACTAPSQSSPTPSLPTQAPTATLAPEPKPSATGTTQTASPTTTTQASAPTPRPTASPIPNTPVSPSASPTRAASASSWEQIGQAHDLRAVTVAEGHGRRIYVGGKGLWRSLDSGVTWETLDPAIEVQSLTAMPDQPDTVYVGASRGCLSGLTLPSFRGDDGGKKLVPIGDNRASFAIHPRSPKLVYTADCQFMRSDDAGATWTELAGAKTQNFDAARISLAPSDPRWLYALSVSEGGSVALRVSSDTGATWQDAHPRQPDGSPTTAPSGLAVAPSNAQVAYLATWDGVWSTRDGGQTWTLATQGLEPARAGDESAKFFRLTTLAVAPEKPEVIFVGTGWEQRDAQGRSQQTGFGVFQSNDGGKTWAKVGDGLDGKLIRDLTLSPDGTVLFAATNEGLYRLKAR